VVGGSGSMTSSLPALTNIRRLQPLRILLAGTDRRFIRVTAFLLSRRGYVVVSTQPAHAVDAAERHRADVVLLEGIPSRTAAARRVADISSLATAPAVVVVTDGGPGALNGVSAVEKWTPLEDLVAEIEAVSLQRHPATNEGLDR
jgi:CheY-like chemotaxis protein